MRSPAWLDLDDNGEPMKHENGEAKVRKVSTFELTIRALGGLMGAHDISGSKVFLDKAIELGDLLLKAFQKNGLPTPDLDLHTGIGYWRDWEPGTCIGEAGSLQMEFRALGAQIDGTGRSNLQGSKQKNQILRNNFNNKHTNITFHPNPATKKYQISRRNRFFEIPDIAFNLIVNESIKLGFAFVPYQFGNADSDNIKDQTFSMFQFLEDHGTEPLRLSAWTDSYYEYLLKLWIQSGKDSRDKSYKTVFIKAMRELFMVLLTKTKKGSYFINKADSQGTPKNEMDHLTCFLPGLLVLASIHFDQVEDAKIIKKFMRVAETLGESCARMYDTATGLAPEISAFDVKVEFEEFDRSDIIVKDDASFNILRPESIESFYYLWYKTGNEKWRKYAKNIFEAFLKHSKVEFGYASLKDVRDASKGLDDRQESFFMAETLKYLYLIFSPKDTINLNEFVFSTENKISSKSVLK